MISFFFATAFLFSFLIQVVFDPSWKDKTYLPSSMKCLKFLLLLLHLLTSSLAVSLFHKISSKSGIDKEIFLEQTGFHFLGASQNKLNHLLYNLKHMFPCRNYFFSEFIPLFLAQREKQTSPGPKITQVQKDLPTLQVYCSKFIRTLQQ